MTTSLKRSGLLLAVGMVGGLLGAVIDRTAMIEKTVLAQQPQPAPGIKRTILQRVDVPGSTTHEVVMALAEVAPGATSGPHFHHGVEIGYVIDGTAIMDHQGRPTATLKGGESFKNDPKAVHEAKNGGTSPARILAVYIVEKGKPLAETAK